MKKIFTLIGIMTVIFSVYFMLLVVDKSNYIDESRISDFSLSKQINLETLEECAKESNVCVQIRTFNNYSFGNTDCKVEVINPAKNVKYGAVRSLFPNRHMKIIKAQKIENRKVRYFTVQENNSTRVSKFKKKLEKSGFEAMVTCKESVEFNLGMLFSPLNIGFFISVFCLALFCTSIYYISRLKEIGILKLNGWSENRISLRLYKDIIKNTAYGFVSGVILFCIYIIIMDVSQLYSYLLMVLFLMLSLNLVYICVAAIAVVFIKNAGYIDSIKNKKNNKIIFIMTMAFKVVLTVVAFIIATQLIENAIRLNEGTKKAEEIEARNWYICTQHISPNEKEEKELNAFVEQYDDKEIFNYCPSDTLLSKYENTKIYKDLATEKILKGLYNEKLASVLAEKSGLKKIKAKDLSTENIESLINTIKNYNVIIDKKRGFNYAQVTAGGVDTSEINAETMESKLSPNLYIVGEMLDVDGICGGYNLHFAWCTGLIAGGNCN